jgi:predicted site-specific integrase-resolvase
MTAKDVAEFLGVGRTTVTELVREGHLQPVNGVNPLLTRQPPYSFYRDEVEALKANPPARPRRGRKPRQS